MPAAPDGLCHQGRLGLQQQANMRSLRLDMAASCFHPHSLQFKCNQGEIFSAFRRHGAGPSLYLFPGAEISDDNLTVRQPGEIVVTVMSGRL